jgi:hypothetical protein
MNVQEFAIAIGSDARTARKFLRSVTPRDAQPGKGSRWSIDAKKVASMKKSFIEWKDARAKVESE